MLRNDHAIGLMREEDLTKSLRAFQKMDLNKQENIDTMKDMQHKVEQIMKYLDIEEKKS
jgi:hypothetical protein